MNIETNKDASKTKNMIWKWNDKTFASIRMLNCWCSSVRKPVAKEHIPITCLELQILHCFFACTCSHVCFLKFAFVSPPGGSVRGILLELEDLGFPCPRRQQILIQTNVFQPKRRWLCLYVLIAELSYKRLYLAIYFAILITLWCMLVLLYPLGCQRLVVPILVYMITWFCTRFEYIHFPKIRLHHLYGSS